MNSGTLSCNPVSSVAGLVDPPDPVSLRPPGSVEATVDLTGLGAGRYTLPVRVAPSRLFGLVRVDPPQVQVTVR